MLNRVNRRVNAINPAALLLTSIKSNERPSEPFHTTINSSKTLDAATAQGSKLRH